MPPVVTTRNSAGERLISLSRASQGGYGWLGIYGPNDADLIRMGASGDEKMAGFITTRNSDDERIISLGTGTQGGYGWFSIHGPNDSDLIRMGAGGDENPAGWVETYDANGNSVITLSRTTTGNGFIETYRSDGQDLVTLTSTTSGKGAVSVHRNDDFRPSEKAASGVIEKLSEDGRYDVLLPANKDDRTVVGRISVESVKINPKYQGTVELSVDKMDWIELSSIGSRGGIISAKATLRNGRQIEGELVGTRELRVTPPEDMPGGVITVPLWKFSEIHLARNRDTSVGE